MVGGQSEKNQTAQNGQMSPHSMGKGKGNAPQRVVDQVQRRSCHQQGHQRRQQPSLHQIEDGQSEHIEGGVLVEDRLLDSKRGGVQELEDGLPSSGKYAAEDDAQHHRSKDDADENQAVQPVESLRRHRQDRLPPGEATGQQHVHRNGHCKECSSDRKQPDTCPQYLGIHTEIPQVVEPEPIGVDAPEHRQRNRKPNETGDDKRPFDDGARHRREH